MSEKLKSVSEARRTLPSLSKSAQGKMDRYIITQQGKPQSVLLGYQDYQSMKVSLELLQRPDVLESIARGRRDLAEGRSITFAELRKLVADRQAAEQTPGAGNTVASKANGMMAEALTAAREILTAARNLERSLDAALATPRPNAAAALPEAAAIARSGARAAARRKRSGMVQAGNA